jgi:hypothetical protein
VRRVVVFQRQISSLSDPLYCSCAHDVWQRPAWCVASFALAVYVGFVESQMPSCRPGADVSSIETAANTADLKGCFANDAGFAIVTYSDEFIKRGLRFSNEFWNGFYGLKICASLAFVIALGFCCLFCD